MKSRGVYETPGCTILHTAHRAIETITMDREVMHLRDSLITKVSELIYMASGIRRRWKPCGPLSIRHRKA